MKYPGGRLIFNSCAWLIACHLSAFAIGFCLYGDNKDCAFQCHCAQRNECDGGKCASGCETGPLGYNWGGPACQIGNIGLKKLAVMTADQGYQKSFPATGALDGINPGGITSECAHPRNGVGVPAEWWTDLEVVHKIYNITIYGRTDCCENRLQKFDLTVYNTSGNEVLCAYFSDIIYTHRTIKCQTPVIGRYVHFKRKGGPEINLSTLCEVVIIGHKYIDCSDCPSGAQCNDITGCDQCVGSYQPDCKQECDRGFYGRNCQQQCGQCKNGTVCDKKNGMCLEGCQIWWTDSKCTTYIELPQPTNETVTVQSITSSSIEIKWHHIDGISPNLTDFYGYLIQFKADTMEDNYTEAGVVSYNSDPYFKLENLELNTLYVIRITAFRQHGDIKDLGDAYNLLTVKTNCCESTSSSSAQVALTAGSASGASITGLVVVVIVILVLLWRRRKAKLTDRIHSFRNEACQHDLEQTEMNTTINGSVNQMDELTVVSSPTGDDNEVREDDFIQERTNCPAEDEGKTEEESIYVNNDISITSFEGYIARKKAKDELNNEYKNLPQPDLTRCNIATTKENKPKNRYRGIYAYDDTRVVLHDDCKNDYINATYIKGYYSNREYIAAQGPKKYTRYDFWRMIWQEKSNRIVMLANVKEMGKDKVDAYWPEKAGLSLNVGAFTVTTEAEHKTADYTIRVITIKKESESRAVQQFHFTSWQDKNKPVHGIHTLLAFIERLHSFDKFSKGPLVVHCSAGVGRTGTFIALDILQQMATQQKTLDVCRCVQRLRHERMLMVQTKSQYTFLHDALIDFIKSRHKTIDCAEFQTKFASVCDAVPDKDVTNHIQSEFKLLSSLKKAEEDPKRSGLQEDNLSKNRNLNIIPDDRDRLFLFGEKTGNYINAVTVDSFKAHDSNVVTQMPLPQTVADFWQLIVEQECQAIVMLNTIDPEDESCVPYWPEKVNTKQHYGRIEVELLSVSHEDFLVVRDLKVTKLALKPSTQPNVRNIRQFQLLSWPTKEDLPPNRLHILYLMEKLQSWQQQHKISADKWKPLIHCIDGGSHSGMFCGAMFLLDKMKIEQEVDAFLTVRYVSTHRPEFFSKLHEYQFLYQIVMDYLTQHNEYANFQ